MTTAQLKLVETKELELKEVAKAYKDIKYQIEALEASLSPYKMVLEEAAIAAPNMTVELEGYKIMLSECSRETIDIKGIKVKLGLDVVSPFLKISNYTQLRVSEKMAEYRTKLPASDLREEHTIDSVLKSFKVRSAV